MKINALPMFMLVASLSLSGCWQTVQSNPEIPLDASQGIAKFALDEVTIEPRLSYGSRLTLGDCATGYNSEESALAALGTAAAAALVDIAFGQLTAALAEAGKDDAQSSSYLGVAEVDTANFPKCIQIARGWFFDDIMFVPEKTVSGNQVPNLDGLLKWPMASGKDKLTAEFNRHFDGLGKTTLSTSDMLLARQPDFFFEGAFVQSGSKNALAVQPLYAVMNKAIKDYTFNDPDHRIFSAVIKLSVADAGKSETASGELALNLGVLETGNPYISPQLLRTHTFSAEFPNYTTWNEAQPGPATWIMKPKDISNFMPFMLSKGTDGGTRPMNFSATITELRKGNEAYTLFSELVSKVGESAKTSLTAKLNEDSATADSAKETLKSDYFAKLGGAHTALHNCASADSEEAAIGLAYVAASALAALNSAAIQYGSGSDLLPALDLSSDGLRTACGQARDALPRG